MQYRFFFSQFWSEDKNTVTLTLHSVFKNGINESTVKSIQGKLAFILGDSMVKDGGGYLLTGSFNRKFIVKVKPF